MLPGRQLRSVAGAAPQSLSLTRRLSAARQAKGQLDYKAAGVDIDAGNELVKRIKKLNPDIGGFSGLYPLGDSYLVAGTDGVGTKLKLAFDCSKHDTIGIDLVAMCVNDIVVCGARPLFFLDYYATGSLDVEVAESVVKGIFQGCQQCGALLMGGETAEMPGMYTPGEYDLAGFAVGAVEKDRVVTGQTISPGDVLLGLPSSGVHSNGFSLVRKVMEVAGVSVHDSAPWDSSLSVGQALMIPTTIYVNDVLKLHNAVGMKGAVHVTGGGFPENIPRVLPEGLGVSIDRSSWSIPPVFQWLSEAGRVGESEMFRTFNMGVGMIVVVSPRDADAAMAALPSVFKLGTVQAEEGVRYVNA